MAFPNKFCSFNWKSIKTENPNRIWTPSNIENCISYVFSIEILILSYKFSPGLTNTPYKSSKVTKINLTFDHLKYLKNCKMAMKWNVVFIQIDPPTGGQTWTTMNLGRVKKVKPGRPPKIPSVKNENDDPIIPTVEDFDSNRKYKSMSLRPNKR